MIMESAESPWTYFPVAVRRSERPRAIERESGQRHTEQSHGWRQGAEDVRMVPARQILKRAPDQVTHFWTAAGDRVRSALRGRRSSALFEKFSGQDDI